MLSISNINTGIIHNVLHAKIFLILEENIAWLQGDELECVNLYFYEEFHFIAKRVISMLVNLRYLRFKLVKYIKKIIRKFIIFLIITSKYTFIYNEKGIIRKVLFLLYDGALTLKMSKMALNPFCDETLHIKT